MFRTFHIAYAVFTNNSQESHQIWRYFRTWARVRVLISFDLWFFLKYEIFAFVKISLKNKFPAPSGAVAYLFSKYIQPSKTIPYVRYQIERTFPPNYICVFNGITQGNSRGNPPRVYQPFTYFIWNFKLVSTSSKLFQFLLMPQGLLPVVCEKLFPSESCFSGKQPEAKKTSNGGK